MDKTHSFEVRKRSFKIWQVLGYNPWKKPGKKKKEKNRRKKGDFYKGAFDSIPFLNDDAKRTFKHLLLRPGYMIRDYINGEHERYLAPLTALIVFYAFFALVSSVMQPVQQKKTIPFNVNVDSLKVESSIEGTNQEKGERLVKNTAQIVKMGYLYLHLDQFPEEVDTRHEAAIAALEGTLRSQGIPLFISKFIFLWLAMSMALRRFKKGMSACAAASAYVLCQFSFFMLFAVLLTFGKSQSINVLLMLLLLSIDYSQWLGVGTKKGIKLAISTGVYYAVFYGIMIMAISLSVFLIAWLKG